MEWYQFLMLEISLIALIGGIYRANQNTIKEWKEEHSRQIANSEKHWRQLFMHFNNRIDQSKGK